MRITLDGVSMARGALAPTSLTCSSGSVTVHGTAEQQGPSVLSLIAGGRMRPDAGSVHVTDDDGHELEGRRARRYLRTHVALVDTPRVCEPFETLTVRDITREELAFAGRHAREEDTDRVLASLGMLGQGDLAIGTVPANTRLRLLAELALTRADVRALVLTSPDRFGGESRAWLAEAERLATRGIAVLVPVTERAWDELAAASPSTPSEPAAAPPSASVAGAHAPAETNTTASQE